MPPLPPGVSVSSPPPPPASFLLQFCVSGYTSSNIVLYNTSLVNGTGSYLGVLPRYIALVNVSSGCDVIIHPSRRLLANAPPPPSLGNCSSLTAVCSNGTAPASLYNASNSVTVSVAMPMVQAASPHVQSQIKALSNTSSASPGTPPAALSALAAQLRSSGMVAVSGVALTAATTSELSTRANNSANGLQQLSQQLNNNTNFIAVVAHARGLSAKQYAAVAAAGASLGALAVLWMVVHALVHAVTAYNLRRTAVTVVLLLQCSTAAQLSGDGGEDEHGTHGTEADPELSNWALQGKRFRAPVAAACLTAFLAKEATAANAMNAVAGPTQVALRPVYREPLLASARGTGTDQDGLALKKKPSNLFWRLKRALGVELRWQAREIRQLARSARRCCSGARADPVGKVFRLVSACNTAVRAATGDSGDSHPAARIAGQLIAGGAPTAVLAEATFYFGAFGRQSAAAWRHRLRYEAPLVSLEAALRAGMTDCVSCELSNVGQVVIALLDDGPHARLDVKHQEAADFSALEDEKTALNSSVALRSFGIAPAAAARLAAVLLLSMRDATEKNQANPV